MVGSGPGCSTVRELGDLNLGGELELSCLQHVTEEHAKSSSIENKHKLTHLSLEWSDSSSENWTSTEMCLMLLNLMVRWNF